MNNMSHQPSNMHSISTPGAGNNLRLKCKKASYFRQDGNTSE